MKETSRTYVSVMSHICISHVENADETCVTHGLNMSHIWMRQHTYTSILVLHSNSTRFVPCIAINPFEESRN